jgi:peptidoglycan-N-acetylglucosamine deacetylase
VTNAGPVSPGRIGWPNGAQCAVAFTFDVDAESPVLAVRPDFADRMSTMSQQAYGPEVGVPRLLGMLDECQIRSTFFVPGYTARRYPEAIKATRSLTTATCTSRSQASLWRKKPHCWTRAWQRSVRSPA